MKIYVGNMSFDTSEDDLRKAFAAHGQIDSVTIITDRDTGRPKGFGFVEMSNGDEANAAIENLNEKDFMGRTIKVNEARPRTEGQRGGGRGGYGRNY
jgi:cold-inducible RNA-binding protein